MTTKCRSTFLCHAQILNPSWIYIRDVPKDRYCSVRCTKSVHLKLFRFRVRFYSILLFIYLFFHLFSFSSFNGRISKPPNSYQQESTDDFLISTKKKTTTKNTHTKQKKKKKKKIHVVGTHNICFPGEINTHIHTHAHTHITAVPSYVELCSTYLWKSFNSIKGWCSYSFTFPHSFGPEPMSISPYICLNRVPTTSFRDTGLLWRVKRSNKHFATVCIC